MLCLTELTWAAVNGLSGFRARRVVKVVQKTYKKRRVLLLSLQSSAYEIVVNSLDIVQLSEQNSGMAMIDCGK